MHLKCQNKTRDRLAAHLALPHTLAVSRHQGIRLRIRRRWRRRLLISGGGETLDSNRSVEILLDMRYNPISNGPSMDPRNGAFRVVAFSEDGGPKCDDGDGCKDEGRGGDAGEETHQVLVRRWTMEPPLQVRRQKAVHRLHVFGTQRVVKCRHYRNADLLLLRWRLWVCQFRVSDECCRRPVELCSPEKRECWEWIKVETFSASGWPFITSWSACVREGSML